MWHLADSFASAKRSLSYASETLIFVFLCLTFCKPQASSILSLPITMRCSQNGDLEQKGTDWEYLITCVGSYFKLPQCLFQRLRKKELHITSGGASMKGTTFIFQTTPRKILLQASYVFRYWKGWNSQDLLGKISGFHWLRREIPDIPRVSLTFRWSRCI